MGSGLNLVKRQVIKLLKDDNFILERCTTHEQWVSERTGAQVTVPNGAGNKALSANVVRKIYKDAGWNYTGKEKKDTDNVLPVVVTKDVRIPKTPAVGLPPSYHLEKYDFNFALGLKHSPKAEKQIDSYDEEFKKRVVDFCEKNSITATCKKFNIRRQLVNAWRDALKTDTQRVEEQIGESKAKRIRVMAANGVSEQRIAKMYSIPLETVLRVTGKATAGLEREHEVVAKDVETTLAEENERLRKELEALRKLQG